MGIIVPEGYMNVSFVHQCQGSIKEAVSSIGAFEALGDTAPADVAEQFYNIAVGVGGPCQAASMSDQWTFLGVSVTKTVDGLPLVGQYFNSLVGTSSADAVLLNAALLINKNTAAGGRKNRGRLYWPPSIVFESTVLPNGDLAPTAQDGYTSMFEDLRTGAEADDYGLYLFHSDATPPTAIISLSAEARMATQRRRMR